MTSYFKLFLTTLCLIGLSACSSLTPPVNSTSGSEKELHPDEQLVYKRINDIELSLHIFKPDDHKVGDAKAAIIFFHGGGWSTGHPSHFYRQAKHLADRGMVAISAEYRVKNRHDTTPQASLMDAKSAIRFVRKNAHELGIDPNRIAAGGGSAGGHIAAGAATATSFEEASDDRSVSYRPNLLVLFNPVFDNSENGYGFKRVKAYWQQFSPLHNISEQTPPGIGFFAEKDTAIKASSAIKFKEQMAAHGTEFKVHIYPNQQHGFFNQIKFNETLWEMDKFLAEQGYIDALPATTYYVDSLSGDDANSGTSKTSAWASLTKVNRHFFMPGDKLLFKRGTEYIGTLEVKGSGSLSAPIVIDAYGKGEKPAIHGQGKKLHTLLLRNVEHWRVSNLSITNLGETRQARRRGVVIQALDSGELENIELSHNEIHQVNGSLYKKQGGGSAILVRNSGDTYPSRFIDLRINDNYIHHTGRNGINFGGYYKRSQWFPNLQVVIKNNLIEQVPGDGIVVMASDGALIEGNVLRDFPDILPEGDAAAGIWPWSADNTLIQFNEVSGHKAKWDGQGYDADFNSKGTIIQYNYSHDNYGGFLLICNNGNKYGQDNNHGTLDTIIRGNVSINDGIRPYPTFKGTFSPTFHITGPTENTKVYDNIVIVPKKPTNVDSTLIEMDNWGGPWPINTLFENNQIYFEDHLVIKNKNVKDFIFKNNQVSKPIAGMPNNNLIVPMTEFDLDTLKRMALSQLEEYKINE